MADLVLKVQSLGYQHVHHQTIPRDDTRTQKLYQRLQPVLRRLRIVFILSKPIAYEAAMPFEEAFLIDLTRLLNYSKVI